MTERWVCKRCFADNNETDSSCTRCGLLRGAEATDTAEAGWAAQGPVVEERQPAWRGLLRFWWIPALAIVLAVGYLSAARRGDDGTLASAGTVSVDDLRVGDCFDTGDEEEIADVDGVPCDEPHGYEVFSVEQHDASSYPTDAEMEAIFMNQCEPAFESYVGVPYADSAIYASMITPSEGSWDDGGREFVCYLFEPADDSLEEVVPLTGSMRGANR